MELIIAISFALITLANCACVQKEGGPVHCCDQREHGGSLRCCAGKNNSCSMMNGHSGLCYCDEYCETARDCCPDFGSVKEPCGWGKRKSDYWNVLCFKPAFRVNSVFFTGLRVHLWMFIAVTIDSRFVETQLIMWSHCFGTPPARSMWPCTVPQVIPKMDRKWSREKLRNGLDLRDWLQKRTDYKKETFLFVRASRIFVRFLAVAARLRDETS